MPSEPVAVSRVAPESLDSVWGHLRPQIQRALSYGQGDGANGDALRELVRDGRAEMWVVHEGQHIQAGIVVSVIDGTIRKLFIDVLVGERMNEWVDELERLLVEYRDLVGAKCVEASCRPGLARKLLNRGWSRKAVVVELT